MSSIEKINVSTGIYWVSIRDADVRILCGCPADSVKHLMKKGLIKEVERQGITFETGPNSILLSDVLIQNGTFANLAEFPLLQMFYRQGLIIPNHPNNTGEKPLLIGVAKQVQAQMNYIYRGNYGLTSIEEIKEGNISQEQAEELMFIKTKFAFGKISPTEGLLDSLEVANQRVEIKNNVYIQRKALNLYEIEYRDEKVTIDLNLANNQYYQPPYELDFHRIRREYFAIIHSGEGDGWDVNRPCMASIIVYQGNLYLIDAGPNILYTLNMLGISVNEITGIFHTHGHDDHFAGLTTLIRADHRIKYYSTPLVRQSVAKKLQSLLSVEGDVLSRYFEIHDLNLDEWNNLGGLEVKPVLSPHPVETNIFHFRTFWEDGYKTYSHLADILSLKTLKTMTEDAEKKGILSKNFYTNIKKTYLTQVDIKKVDVGGGMIHGESEDFKDDTSEKIILSHTANPFTDKEKEIGSTAPFGTLDVLIASNEDYTHRFASNFLRAYYPNVIREELRMLVNCPKVEFNAGSILLKKGETSKFIYLILTGNVEMIDTEHGVKNMLTAGSMVGEMTGLMEVPSRETYRAASFVSALKIRTNLYFEFIRRNDLYSDFEHIQDDRSFLQSTWLFGEVVSHPMQNYIARQMELVEHSAGEKVPLSDLSELLIVKSGAIEILSGGSVLETLTTGNFCREETVIYDSPTLFDTIVTETSEIFHIPGKLLHSIPVVQWKLFETFERRLKTFGEMFF